MLLMNAVLLGSWVRREEPDLKTSDPEPDTLYSSTSAPFEPEINQVIV